MISGARRRVEMAHAVQGLATSDEVLPGAADACDDVEWVAAWRRLAVRAAGDARRAEDAGDRGEASRAHLRASAYQGVVVDALLTGLVPGDAAAAYRGQRAGWETFVALSPFRSLRVDIPYGLSSLPAYLLRAPSEKATGATLVAVTADTVSLASLWTSCAHPALERGCAVVVFDGPGQRSQLFERGIGARADWEHVLTPIYDFVARSMGSDPTRIGLYAGPGAGARVVRALVHEHRFAAAAIDGLDTAETSGVAPLLTRITTPLRIGSSGGCPVPWLLQRLTPAGAQDPA